MISSPLVMSAANGISPAWLAARDSSMQRAIIFSSSNCLGVQDMPGISRGEVKYDCTLT
jgi:hypothetical protein